MVKTDIKEAIANVEDWDKKNVEYSPVSGGITNPNFKVNVDGVNYFLKIPGAGTDYIDRDNCHQANVIAGESGAGPKVCYYFNDTGVEIFEWLEGYRQVTFGDVYNKELFKKIFEIVSEYHNYDTAPLPRTESLFDQAWDMNNRVKKFGYIPPWNDRMEYLLKVIENAMNENGIQLKPCHNDFWTNNLMYNEETGDMKLIDYEYASMNDPYSDLGLIAGCNYFTEDMDMEMIKIYNGGEFDDMGFAKMKLYKIVCDIKWAYWALLQASSSEVEFDYMHWYGEKMARLQHFWLDPRLDIWINKVSGKTIF